MIFIIYLLYFATLNFDCKCFDSNFKVKFFFYKSLIFLYLNIHTVFQHLAKLIYLINNYNL